MGQIKRNLYIKPKLINSISKVFIIACKESTQQLEDFFLREGFQCEVIRQERKPEYEHYSRSYLCLLNHRNAWEKAAKETQFTLIIEADFVPVIGFANLPLPFNLYQSNVGVAWLYTCVPRLYEVSPDGYAEGWSTSAVAYIVNPKSANYLIELAEEIALKKGPTYYSAWDSNIDTFLRQRNLKNYIPWRDYGEHGGISNSEHAQHGLGAYHRADVLYGELAFMPFYSIAGKNAKLKLLLARLEARLRAIYRLFVGRYLKMQILQNSKEPFRLLIFSISRHFSLHL